MWSRLLKRLSNREKNSSSDASIFSSKNKKILAIILTSLLPVLLSIIAIILIVLLPILLIQQFIFDSKAEGPTLFTNVAGHLVLNEWCKQNDIDCTKHSTQMFYERIEQVNNEYQEKGKSIDIELLTATIYYGKTLDEELFSEESEEETTLDIIAGAVRLSDVDKLASNMVSGNQLDYTKYKEYLINTYIPKRFSDMYEDSSDKDAEIERIADEIMAFASLEDGMGSGGFANCNVINTSCTGVTISGGQYAGTYTLEEYVAGVLAHEVGAGWPDEALKAQAIAARTYMLNYTNNCSNAIPNSTGAQTFEPTTNERIIAAANETAGMVLTYDNQIFSSEYGSWWGSNPGTSCGSYNNCQNGMCSINLYKAPNRESWTFSMPQNYFSYGQVTDNIQMSDGSIQALGGHCRGMSQFGAKYLDLGEHYSYDRILQTFYSDGVQLSTFGNSQNSCPQGTSSQGLIASNYKGFMQRVSNPTASDYYYSQNYFYSSNVGQCVWYAQRRGLEIINTIDIDEGKRKQAEQALMNTTGNGRDWWNNPSLKMFGSSTNYEEPKVGAIIVWRYTSSNIANYGGNDYGHVAVVEAVDYENRTVTVSDGWKSNWNNPNSINYASFGFRTVPFEWVLNYGNPSKYIFMGYVYLLD